MEIGIFIEYLTKNVVIVMFWVSIVWTLKYTTCVHYITWSVVLT